MLTIFTSSIGRELYLRRLLLSIQDFGGNMDCVAEHIIVFQETEPSADLLALIQNNPLIKPIFRKELASIGVLLNELSPSFKGRITFKLDDDAALRSPSFFQSILDVHSILGDAMFSPFPVGLIGNLGGPAVEGQRKVVHSQERDIYYTLRPVKHVGGFARISPTGVLQDVKFSDAHKEDGELSAHCLAKGIPMFYLENGLIVEHQETMLGQKLRCGEAYFRRHYQRKPDVVQQK